MSYKLVSHAAEIAAKVIDGEAILINLANGLYYSLDGVGGLIWSLIEDGQCADRIVDEVTARYEVSRDHAAEDLARLADQLIAHELVSREPVEASPAGEAAAPGAGRLPYVQPTLQVHDDMEDLLALDPPMPQLGKGTWKDDAS